MGGLQIDKYDTFEAVTYILKNFKVLLETSIASLIFPPEVMSTFKILTNIIMKYNAIMNFSCVKCSHAV